MTRVCWGAGNNRIAYDRWTMGIISVDGTGAERQWLITPDPMDFMAASLEPDWRPDGAVLAYSRGGGYDPEADIVLWDGVSGTTRRLVSPGADSWPSWSSDGTRIAFVSDRSGNRDIWVYTLGDEGGEQGPVVEVISMLQPDGTYLLELDAEQVPAGVTAVTVDGPGGIQGVDLPKSSECEDFTVVYPQAGGLSSVPAGDYVFTFTGGGIAPMTFTLATVSTLTVPQITTAAYTGVSWDQVASADHYYLNIRDAAGAWWFDGEDFPRTQTTVDLTPYMMTRPDGSYEVQVVAVDAGGNEAYSAFAPFTKGAVVYRGSITGMVAYDGWQAGMGSIYVGVFSDSEMTQPAGSTVLTGGPGSFTVTDLPIGQYWVGAFFDNEPLASPAMPVPGPEDPAGDASGNPVTVETGQEANAGTITLALETPEGGSITGEVVLSDWVAGDGIIYAGAFSDSEMTQLVGYAVLTTGPGQFTIADLPIGQYWVGAFLDNEPFVSPTTPVPGPEDPIGAASGNPVTVTAGTEAVAGQIDLGGEPGQGSVANIIYMRHTAGFRLEFMLMGDVSGVSGVTVSGPQGSNVVDFPLVYDPAQDAFEGDEWWSVYPSFEGFVQSVISGTYLFSISGEQTSQIPFDFQPATPLMDLPAAVAVNASTGELTWQAVNGAAYYYLNLYSGTDPVHEGEDDDPLTQPAFALIDAMIEDAAPDGDYSVQVVAVDSRGNEAYSAPVSFTKDAGALCYKTLRLVETEGGYSFTASGYAGYGGLWDIAAIDLNWGAGPGVDMGLESYNTIKTESFTDLCAVTADDIAHTGQEDGMLSAVAGASYSVVTPLWNAAIQVIEKDDISVTIRYVAFPAVGLADAIEALQVVDGEHPPTGPGTCPM